MTFGYRPDALWSRIAVAGLALQVGDRVPWVVEVEPVDENETGSYGDPPQPMSGSPIKVNRRILETRQAELFEESDNATGHGGHE